MHFQLVPKSSTLDDLELLYIGIFTEFCGYMAIELIETPVLLISSCGPKYTYTTASWSLHWRYLNMSESSYMQHHK